MEITHCSSCSPKGLTVTETSQVDRRILSNRNGRKALTLALIAQLLTWVTSGTQHVTLLGSRTDDLLTANHRPSILPQRKAGPPSKIYIPCPLLRSGRTELEQSEECLHTCQSSLFIVTMAGSQAWNIPTHSPFPVMIPGTSSSASQRKIKRDRPPGTQWVEAQV